MPRPVIRSCIANRQVDHAQRFISAHGAPAIGCASSIGLVGCGFAMFTRVPQIPRPRELASKHIVCTNHARRLPDANVVGNPTPQYDSAADNGGRGTYVIEAWVDITHAFLEIDRTHITERPAEVARVCIDRKQPRVKSETNDALGAIRRILDHGIGYATASSHQGGACRVHFRIVAPSLLAGL